MFLKSIEIQGFKSFPDKTRLTFGQGITAVVGPNGSGKSNISDAIRWVMGEMSAKTLRGSRMEDVVFGGTVARRALGFAEVSLVIDNGDRSLAVEDDEVKVTRRYYRSGESEYLLNGSEVRMRDIYELFLDTGLGRDGYSIIGQGRIAEIVAAKSADRREIFEEAAGIAKYRYRKEESERRLAAAEENLVRLRDILTELADRLGPLQEQSQKAKRYLELAQEKKTLEVGLWLHTLDRQMEALREHENRLGFARAQYDAAEEKLDRFAREIEEAYLASQKAAARADEARARARESEEEAAKTEASAAVIENDIARNDADIMRIREEIAAVEAEGRKAREEAGRRAQDLGEKEKRLAGLREELAACENDAQALTGRSAELSERSRAGAQAVSLLNAEMARLRVANGTARSSLEHVRGRLADIGAERQLREARLTQAEEELAQSLERLAKRQEDAQALRNALKGYELKEEARRGRLREVEERERALSLKLSERKQRAAMLLDLERNLEGFSHSVKFVMREHGRGLLTGIHGPVSKLLRVPDAYTVAVETALGGAMQHIVVENEESAKAAIRSLQRGNGGRATFLPLTSVRGGVLEQTGLAGEDGYVGVASELVQCDAQYGGVVRSLLGRTAVARDLDCAVKIAKAHGYRFRIVTLDGQLVNAGGSLTGGSANRGAGLLSRAGEIERLRREAEEIARTLEKTGEEKKAAAAELSSLQASVSGVKGELTTAQEDSIRLEGEKKSLLDRTATAQNEIAALEREKGECTEKAGAFAAEEAQAAARMEEISRQIAEQEEELEKLGEGRGELESRRAAQTEKLTSLRLSALACEKDIEAAHAGMEELRRRMDTGGARAAELAQQIAAVKNSSEAARQNAGRLRTRSQELRGQAAQLLQTAEQEMAARQETERKTVELRAAERGLSDEREKISRELTRLEERKAAAQAEYDAVVARLWEEYELTRSQAEQTAGRIEDPAGAQKRLNGLKREIKELGDVNVGAIDEYTEVSQRYAFLKTQTDDVEKSKAELTDLIGDLTDKMREIFARQFVEINRHFSTIFTELFGGGTAKLTLTEPEDVLASGIEIIVQPPGKIIKNLSALSGGEQAFVAIALYFAILKVRPSPFCVLDEIEAALDDANVSRFAAYLRRMCDNTQFIVITHRRGTMDEADVLYGVTMQEEGVSKLLTLNVSELVGRLGLRE